MEMGYDIKTLKAGGGMLVPPTEITVQALCPPLSNRNFARIQELSNKKAVIGRRSGNIVVKISSLMSGPKVQKTGG